MKKGYWIVAVWAVFITAVYTFKDVHMHAKQELIFETRVIFIRAAIKLLIFLVPSLIAVYWYYSQGKKKKEE